MDNIFMAHVKKHSLFSWGRMGDIKAARPTMGEDMKIIVYRLLQQSLMDILVRNIGTVKADHFFIESGRMAGYELAMHNLVLEQSPEDFFKQLSEIIYELKIGIFTLESYNSDTGELSIAIANDLDCSGITSQNKALCKFDEGFLSGLLGAFTGEDYDFREVDCWGQGEGTCRFIGNIK